MLKPQCRDMIRRILTGSEGEESMLRNLGNPFNLKVSMEREIAEALAAGLEGRDIVQALVVTFPDAPLKDVMAAWHAVQPADVGEPGPGQALRAIHGAETMPPAALDGADLRIEILQKVDLGRDLCSTQDTLPQGMLCMLHAAYDALRYVGASRDSLAPLQQYITAKSGGGNGEWGAQTFLALTLECYLVLGEKIGPAARTVIAELNGPAAWLCLYPRPDLTLREWHKNLLHDRRVPRDGEHRQILDEVLPRLRAARQLKPSPERDAGLRQAAEAFLRSARTRLVGLYS
jgi:hypothetical protein